jgi:hypothetical protein
MNLMHMLHPSHPPTPPTPSSRRSSKEMQRRREIVRKHTSEFSRLKAAEKSVVASTDRDALLAATDRKS